MSETNQPETILIKDLKIGQTLDVLMWIKGCTPVAVPPGSKKPKITARAYDHTGELRLVCWEWSGTEAPPNGAYRIVGNVRPGFHEEMEIQTRVSQLEPAPEGADISFLLPQGNSSSQVPADAKNVSISEMQIGMVVEGDFIYREIKAGVKERNQPDLQGKIVDTTGELRCIFHDWDDDLPIGGAYHVVGKVSEFRGVMEVHGISLVPCPEDVDLSHLLPKAKRPVAEMWDELTSLRNLCRDPFVSKLLDLCFEDEEVKGKLLKNPAAVNHHHNYMGGLLEHTLEVTRTAIALTMVYPFLGLDEMIAGGMLHDIGKVLAYEFKGVDPAMTNDGRSADHLVLGYAMVKGKIKTIPEFPQDLENVILNMILSHHGRLKWGACVLPCSPEGYALHYCDNLSAGLKTVIGECGKAIAAGNDWTERTRSTDEDGSVQYRITKKRIESANKPIENDEVETRRQAADLLLASLPKR